MLKFISFLRNLKKIRISFVTPKKCDLIVFEERQISDLRYILNKRKYFVLNYKEDPKINIYLSFKILLKILKYFKGNLYSAYLASIIELISPKLVITFFDNSIKFYDLNILFKNKIQFLAIQNGGRTDILHYKHEYKVGLSKKDLSKRIFLQNYLCFGSNDVKNFKKFKVNVQNFFKVGSLRLANFLKDCRIKKKIKYDICLISDLPRSNYLSPKAYNLEDIEKGYKDLIINCIKFCKKFKKKFVFARKDYGTLYANDKKFLKEKLNKSEYNFLKKNSVTREKDKYSSYKAIYNSNVVIGVNSTMLFEKISLGGKIMACNYTKCKIFDLPVNKYAFSKISSYLQFEKKLLDIIKISEAKFINKINSKNCQLIESHKINTIKKINEIIDKKI